MSTIVKHRLFPQLASEVRGCHVWCLVEVWWCSNNTNLHSDIVTVSLVVTWPDQQRLDLNKYLMSRLPPDSRPGDRSHNNHTNYICTAIPVSAQVRNNLRFKKILFIISSISTKIASLRSVKGWPFKSRKENFNGCWSSRNDLLLRLQVL